MLTTIPRSLEVQPLAGDADVFAALRASIARLSQHVASMAPTAGGAVMALGLSQANALTVQSLNADLQAMQQRLASLAGGSR